MPLSISLFCKKYTIGDSAAALEGTDLFLEDADFLCQTNDVYLGNRDSQELLFVVDATLNRRLINLKELFAKNKTGGSTGYVIVLGNLVTMEGS